MTPRRVASAVAKRLLQIDRHAQRLTPEADEVRLAVHAAGAQLSDPSMVPHLREMWPPGEPDALPTAWVRPLSTITSSLAAQARMVIGASGGWNASARRRLAHIARSNRVNAFDLVAAVRPSGGGVGSVAPNRVRRLMPGLPLPSGFHWAWVHASLAAMLLLMLVLIAREAIRPSAEQPATAIQDGDFGAAPLVTERSRSGDDEAPRIQIEHHSALEQELRRASELAVSSPGSCAERTARAIRVHLTRWTEAPPEARERIVDVISETALRLSARPDTRTAWAEPLTAVAESSPGQRAYARAIMLEVTDQPELSMALRTELLASVGLSPGVSSSTLRSGRLDARVLTALTGFDPPMPPDDPEWWSAWSAAANACTGVPQSLRVAASLGALDRRIRDQAPPSSGLGTTIRALASLVPFRRGSQGSRWLIEVIADPGAPTVRVAALTEALAVELSVPGVDATMVLDAFATNADRSELAARYAAELSPVAGDDQVAAMLQALSIAIAAGSPSTDPIEVQQRILDLATVNAASAWLAAGEPTASDAMIDRIRINPSPGDSGEGSPLSQAWGLAALNEEGSPAIQTLLREAAQATRLSDLAATGLVSLAVSGSDSSIRSEAATLLVRFRGDPQLLLALERRVSRRRPSSRVRMLVGQVLNADLSSFDTEAWVPRVRALFVQRLAEIRASDTPAANFSRDLGEIYGVRPGTDEGGTLADNARNARRALADLLEQSAFESDDGGAEVRLARTPMQRFLVENRAFVLRFADALGTESPAVRRVLDDLSTRLPAAESIYEQILICERAQARLWTEWWGVQP